MLRNFKQFINYKLEQRPTPQKPDKIPIDALTGKAINPHDTRNHLTFAEAYRRAVEHRLGIGFDLQPFDGVGCLDIDGCRNPVTGELTAEAQAVLARFPGAFCEVSVSQTGVHLWLRCNKALFEDRARKFNGVEFYVVGRFIALGNHMAGDFSRDWTQELLDFVPLRATSAALPQLPNAPTLTDAEIAERIGKALANRGSAASAFGSKASFAALWAGDAEQLARFFPSATGDTFDRSAADASLMWHLSFWLGRDPGAMDRAFRQSGLMRDKWERPDYRRNTISNANAAQPAVYEPHALPTPTGTGLANIWNPQNQITENAVALGFAEQEQGRILYTDAGFWWWWDEDRGVWQRDTNQKVFSKVRDFCDRETGGLKEHTTLKFISAVLKLASADRRLVGRMDDFDSDDWKLNTPTGIVDLRSGALLKHDPRFLMTKIAGTGFDPNAQCPRWLAFLNDIFEGDQGRIEYWQHILGCCLTGDISEHVIIFAYGTGTNGKSVSLDVARGIMGDYACETQAETLMFKRGGPSHPTELAALHGARMVFASELEDGKQWDIARLKKLTGDQTITARFMTKDFFTFPRKFKLLIVGNHQPKLRAVDEAIRRMTLPPTSIQPEGDSGGRFGRFGRGERRGLARSWSLSGAADPVAG